MGPCAGTLRQCVGTLRQYVGLPPQSIPNFPKIVDNTPEKHTITTSRLLWNWGARTQNAPKHKATEARKAK